MRPECNGRRIRACARDRTGYPATASRSSPPRRTPQATLVGSVGHGGRDVGVATIMLRRFCGDGRCGILLRRGFGRGPMAGRTVIITGASDGSVPRRRPVSRSGENVVVVGRSTENNRGGRASGCRVLRGRFRGPFTGAEVGRAAAAVLSPHRRAGQQRRPFHGRARGHRRRPREDVSRSIIWPRSCSRRYCWTGSIESRATVLNTSSVVNRFFGRIDIDDLDAARGYRALRAYGQREAGKHLVHQGTAPSLPRRRNLHCGISSRRRWRPISATSRGRGGFGLAFRGPIKRLAAGWT